MKRPAQLVFIPGPGIGHIVSTVEIAKQLLARDHQLSITILVMKLPHESSSSKQKATHDNSSSSHDRINFINLPEPEIDTNSSFMSFFKAFVERHKPNVKEAITKLLTKSANPESSQNPRLAGFVVDMFCTTMIDVANEFGVPSYVFFTSSAMCLTFLFHLQSLRDDHGQDVSELIDSKTEFVVPSFVNPVPTSVFPSPILNREGLKAWLHNALRFRETKGILVNSISELQSSAIHYLSNDTTIPPVYPVGPLLSLKSGTEDSHVDSEKSKQKSHIFKWLDDQPPLSVVFLCFGSMGSFDEAQVKEIAWALEHSGFRFLWSLRQPQPKGKMGMPSDYADFNEVLPEGFLNRTVGIGKIIGWAPQTEILAHPAIGGFVSHCGWNSTLESLWYGVPIATWPLYAEQQLNAFELVKELGLGVEIKMDYRKESEVVLSAKDIERGIRQLMVEDSEIRKKVKEISENSHKALMEGGSSYSSLGNFIDQI